MSMDTYHNCLRAKTAFRVNRLKLFNFYLGKPNMTFMHVHNRDNKCPSFSSIAANFQ